MENCLLRTVFSNGNQNSAGSDIDLQVAVDINMPWMLQYKNKEYSFTIAWNPCCCTFFSFLRMISLWHTWITLEHATSQHFLWFQPCGSQENTYPSTSTFTSQSVQCDVQVLWKQEPVSSGHLVYSSKPQLNWQPFHNTDFGIGCKECCRPSLRYIFRTG